MNLKEEVQKILKGEALDDEETLTKYSHDASLFEVRPKLVVFPKDKDDLMALVRYIELKRKDDPTLSLTVRAGGSCMSAGSLNESIIADLTKYMNKIGSIMPLGTAVEPGAFYRDFEIKTLEKGLILPCFPASKNLAALGGMIGNNAAGEKTLRWGKMDHFVLESKVILSDGNEYDIKPLSPAELEKKISQNDFEGSIYKQVKELIETNKEVIERNRPRVSKNSAGYAIWNVWDGTTFNLNKLFVGAQGTLGITTEATIGLIEVEPVSKLFVVFLPNLTNLAELVNEILPTDPETVESYDDATLKLAFRFFPEMLRTMKVKSFFKLMLSFIPEGFMMLRSGFPKLVLLVEYTGKTEAEVDRKMNVLEARLKRFGLVQRKTVSTEESDKYWTIRRESFNLLRKHVHGTRTAPFVDDVVVEPKYMPEFLPKMRAILDEAKLNYTIAGHAGNGNFHIIPLMDMRKRENIEVIKSVGEKVYDLVHEYHGSITGEHNDGLVRTPYLGKMFDNEMLDLFKKVKDIFDPQNIFNPNKKVGATVEYMSAHIAIEKAAS